MEEKKKPSIRGVLRTMKVGEKRRWPIEVQRSTKSQMTELQLQLKVKYRLETAKNKNSFTVERIL